MDLNVDPNISCRSGQLDILSTWFYASVCASLSSLIGPMTAVHSSLFPPILMSLHGHTFPISPPFSCICLSGSMERQGQTTSRVHTLTHADTQHPHLCWPLLHLPQGLGVRQPGTRQLFKPSGSFTTGRRQKQKQRQCERKRERASEREMNSQLIIYWLTGVLASYRGRGLERTETLWSLFKIISMNVGHCLLDLHQNFL